MKSSRFSTVVIVASLLCIAVPAADPSSDRACSVTVLTRVAHPVLTALAEGRWKQDLLGHDWERGRASYTGLESLGRTMAGTAPGLELEPDETREGISLPDRTGASRFAAGRSILDGSAGIVDAKRIWSGQDTPADHAYKNPARK